MNWNLDFVGSIEKKVNSRPDRDGIVTVEEANDWYKKGSGKPLYVDISKMKFKSSPVSVKDLKEGEMQQINFFNMGDIHLSIWETFIFLIRVLNGDLLQIIHCQEYMAH